ncbi:MAG: inorganic diphosphatase [Gammaproteobacteria bacterium]|nr:inorganic diphosphatase [Gammaproteobacteria bacterium]
MNIDKISIGNDAPNEVNVIIEVPFGGHPIKYEMDKASGAIFVDRYLSTAMRYPCNYGFVPHTLSDDGDPIDVLVIGNTPLMPGCVIAARPVGVLVMEDEAGQDEKIVAVPSEKLSRYHGDIQDYSDIPKVMTDRIAHFFEQYKALEPNKWVKVHHWGNVEEAKRYISDAIANAMANAKT